MHNLAQGTSVPSVFSFESQEIRSFLIDDQPWFVVADICSVLNISNPSESIKALDEDEKNTLSLTEGIQSASRGNPNVNIINESGLYTLILRCRDAVKQGTVPHRFKKWVTGEVLPSIRKTGQYTDPNTAIPDPNIDYTRKARSFSAYIRVSKLIGFKGNQAILSANRFAKQTDGVDWLALFGATHLVAEQQTRHYTPTELGKKFGLSARKFNRELEKYGLQIARRDTKGSLVYTPTDKGEAYSVLLDTGKKHGNGTPVQQLKWKEAVLEVLLTVKEV